MAEINPADASKSISAWMDEAIALARKAALEGEVPVGAVVVHRGAAGGQPRIVGRGYNKREQDQDPLAHAEILALAEASRTLKSWRLTDCLLVVTLEPCPMCLAASQQARIDEVRYGATDPKGGALSLGYRLHEDTRTNHRFPVVLQEFAECGQVLREFFAAMRTRSTGPKK